MKRSFATTLAAALLAIAGCNQPTSPPAGGSGQGGTATASASTPATATDAKPDDPNADPVEKWRIEATVRQRRAVRAGEILLASTQVRPMVLDLAIAATGDIGTIEKVRVVETLNGETFVGVGNGQKALVTGAPTADLTNGRETSLARFVAKIVGRTKGPRGEVVVEVQVVDPVKAREIDDEVKRATDDLAFLDGIDTCRKDAASSEAEDKRKLFESAANTLIENYRKSHPESPAP